MAFDKEAFGAKLASLRKQAGLTQLVAARMLDVTDKAVSKWEKGGSFPSMESMLKISELYHVPLTELFAAAEKNSKRVVTVVLTGGPCAGKSMARSWIMADMQKKHWKVIFVPEAATELINAGITQKSAGSVVAFQRCVMKLQLAKEEQYKTMAESMPESHILLVFDRGIMDGKAFVTNVQFQGLLRECGLTEVEARDRYDAVFHLVTAAKGAADHYKTSNNPARRETPEQAATVDDKMIQAWSGHPRMRIIDNSTGFEEKLKRLITELSDITGTPGPGRFQRKYLIEMPDLSALENLPTCTKVETIHTYLKSPKTQERRVRRRGADGDYLYTKTVKEETSPGVKLRAILSEDQLTEAEYLKELTDADPTLAPLRKDRYCICENDRCVQVDVFPFWKDQAILELPLANETDQPDIPKMFKVIKDITGDAAYRNRELARTIAKHY